LLFHPNKFKTKTKAFTTVSEWFLEEEEKRQINLLSLAEQYVVNRGITAHTFGQFHI